MDIRVEWSKLRIRNSTTAGSQNKYISLKRVYKNNQDFWTMFETYCGKMWHLRILKKYQNFKLDYEKREET
jgi:hypothetical protein